MSIVVFSPGFRVSGGTNSTFGDTLLIDTYSTIASKLPLFLRVIVAEFSDSIIHLVIRISSCLAYTGIIDIVQYAMTIDMSKAAAIITTDVTASETPLLFRIICIDFILRLFLF